MQSATKTSIITRGRHRRPEKLEKSQIFGDKACHAERSEGSRLPAAEILSAAKDDSQDTPLVRSRQALSPNVWKKALKLDNSCLLSGRISREEQHFPFFHRQGHIHHGQPRILLFKSNLFPTSRRHPLGQVERFYITTLKL
jgi:hypothetical protein